MFLDQSIGEKPTSATSTKNLERLQTEFLIPRTLRNNSQAWLHFAMWHHLCLNYWSRAWLLQLCFLVCYAPSLYDKRFQFSGCRQHAPKHSIVFIDHSLKCDSQILKIVRAMPYKFLVRLTIKTPCHAHSDTGDSIICCNLLCKLI